MKKILLLLAIAISIMGCSKENDTKNASTYEIISDELDVEEFAFLLNAPISEVRATYKGYLINKTYTDRKIELSYYYPTKEKEYTVLFSFNEYRKLQKVEIKTPEKMSYTDGINFTKKLSDRIAKIYIKKVYWADVFSEQSYGITFTEREKFWEYVTKYTIDYSMCEAWGLIDKEDIGHIILSSRLYLYYYRNTNTFIISAEHENY